jgi:L,D-peptidoglycan transpeptidase YkuD (ErfK/YbiS/YcfS/YnhG family)
MSLSRRKLLGACIGLPLSRCATLMTQANEIDVSGPAGATEGHLRFGALAFPCMLGRAGIVSSKHEGDGGTPAGTFALRQVRYRPDRLAAPSTKGLVVIRTQESDGWCDDPSNRAYNRPVRLPYPASAEKMWRDDGVYDLLAVIGYNDAPPVAGLGSAIFLHVARPTKMQGRFAPTVGCVSLKLEDLRSLLAACSATTTIRIRTV